jgi:hypothetical protein
MTYENFKSMSIDSILLKIVQAQMTRSGANVQVFDEIITVLDKLKTDKNKHIHLDNLQKLADSEYKVLNQFRLYDLITDLVTELR